MAFDKVDLWLYMPQELPRMSAASSLESMRGHKNPFHFLYGPICGHGAKSVFMHAQCHSCRRYNQVNTHRL